jgi:hypothetical protein
MLRSAVVAVVLAAASGTALAGFAGTDLFIPMAGRGVGAYPSNWFTTVYLYNPNAEVVSVDLSFLERNKDNVATAPPRITDTLAPGETRIYENIVEATFGKTAYGAVRIQCSEKVVASARVFSKESENAPLTQSFGQDFAATPASFAIGLGEATDILGGYTTQPFQDSDARFNIGCVETTGLGSATVRWTARDAAGVERDSYDRVVPRLSQTQGFFHDYFTSVGLTNSRVSASVVGGTGKVICYGSLVTNDKEFPKPVQDPTTFEMVYPEKLLGIATVQHDATLVGDGTAGAPLGLADGAVTLPKLGTTNIPSPAPPGGIAALAAGPPQVLTTDGSTLSWQAVASGDITAVTTAAGSGLSGGAESGPANLAVAAGGITSSMIQDGAVATGDLANSAVTIAKLSASGGSTGKVLKHDGSTVVWGTDLDSGLTLPYSQSVSSAGAAFVIANTGGGTAVRAESYNAPSVVAQNSAGFAVNAASGASDFVSGPGAGVLGHSNSRIGVFGWSKSARGVLGQSASSPGVEGISSSGAGVRGESTSGDGVQGSAQNGRGVQGTAENGFGVVGSGRIGVYGTGTETAVRGESDTGTAVFANASGSGTGVRAFSGSGTGVKGESAFGSGEDKSGVYGKQRDSGNYGLLGSDTYGALGRRGDDSAVGYLGADHGVYGRCNVGGSRYAGYFNGPVATTSLAGSGNRDVYADSNGKLIISTSDGRLKRDVLDLAAQIDVLAALARLRGVTYSWDTAQERAAGLGGHREIGMIAQEVEAVLPELVGETGDGYKSLDYAKLTAFLVEVTKAQQERITALEQRLAALESARSW